MVKYVMGIDIGTTGSKAMIIDLDGKVVGAGYREYPLDYPKPNYVEVDADYLMEMVYDSVAEAIQKSGVPGSDIAAISFSVQRATFAMLDNDLQPIGNKFYVWLDNRAEVVMDEIYAAMDRDYMFQITGMPITRTYSLEKLYWLKKFEPQIYDATKYFALVDAYAMWCFGADSFCSEASNAMVSGMMDVRTLKWNDEVMNALNLRTDLLPPLVDPGTVVGKVGAAISKRTGLAEGTLVVSGSGDQQAAAMGAGVIEDGSMSLTLGTVGELVVGLAKPDFSKLNNLMIPCTPKMGIFEIEGNQISGATCYRWARDVICTSEVALGEAMGVDPYVLMENYINKSAPGSGGVIFQAGLFGTGYPTWNGEATASFVGLKSSNTRADMLRAVMEGITMESRFIYEAIKETGVYTKDTITITGGATKSPAWCQIIADVMGCTLHTLEVPDAALIGVATLAAIGAGAFKDTREGVEKMVRTVDTITPNAETVKFYDKLFPIYKDIYYALNDAGIFSKLAKL